MKREIESELSSVEQRLAGVEKVTQFVFANKALLQQALTHPSAVDARLDSNSRLSFVGSEAVRLFVSEYLFEQRRVEESVFFEMDWRALYSALGRFTSANSVAYRADKLHLSDALLLGKGMEIQRVSLSDRVRSNAFQALVAASIEDQGIDVARERVHSWMLDDLPNEVMSAVEFSFRKIEFEKVRTAACEKYGKGIMYFWRTLEDLRSGDDSITYELRYNDTRLGLGEGKNTKDAKAKALLNALQTKRKWPKENV